MPNITFPDLTLADWHPTRDTLQLYAQVVGYTRSALMPRMRHWEHGSLRTTATGLTTTPVPHGAQIFDIRLDFIQHTLSVVTSRGYAQSMPIFGQPIDQFCGDVLGFLANIDVNPQLDRSPFRDVEDREYDVAAVRRFWQAISQIDMTLKRFKGEQRKETSPVQLWPHHFDLAMLWFSGRLVPDTDPDDEENADEQMNFGFSTGDESIGDAYFYCTAYPLPDGLTDAELPGQVYWHTEGFTAAILPYRELVASDKAEELLLEYWRSFHAAGAALMS